MIAHLRGKLVQKEPARVIVDVNGVGYEVFIPLTTYTALPDAGSEVSIDVHTHVREDIIALYGFSTRRERSIFEKLMTISGICALTPKPQHAVPSTAIAIRPSMCCSNARCRF